jgi:predicted dehydrogenase
MSRQVGFGFIGAGEIAMATAAAVQASEHADLVRVVDARADLAQDLAATYGGRPAATVEELLADPTVEAVYIAVPHYLHKQLAVQSAAAGKHVLIEKPMGIGPGDAQAIVDACRQHGVACGVPFVARYAPAYRQARQLVQHGAIGRVTGFRIVYRADKPLSYWSGGYSGRATSDWRQNWATAGGGVLIMNVIHDLDCLLWITGVEVEQVEGVVANTGSPGEVEDVALAILHGAGGVLATIEALAAVPGGQGPTRAWVNRIYGSTGQIVLPAPWANDPLALFTRETGRWQTIEGATGTDARRMAVDDFAAAVRAGAPAPIPGEAGLYASRILHAIYAAARHGGRVAVTDSTAMAGDPSSRP